METNYKWEAWSKTKGVSQNSRLKPKDTWAIRIYLQSAHAARDLAMFNLAIDCKLQALEHQIQYAPPWTSGSSAYKLCASG